MTGAYVDKSYVYAVARVRYAELKLLDGQALDQLESAATVEDACHILNEKGWGDENAAGTEELLLSERTRLWEFIDEIVPERSIFDVFNLPNDYSNLKAAIKESVMEYDYPGIYVNEGTVDPEVIRTAIRERDYRSLPGAMEEAASEAHQTFLRTSDGQLCDVICDRACLEAILKAGKESGDSFLESYAETFVASADIKTAARAAATGKNRDFLEMALADCGSVDKKSLIQAAAGGVDQVSSYLSGTSFSEGAALLRESPASFECWCDNLITEGMRTQLYESFGLGPIAAYILAKENEIKSVRIILSGILNGFSKEMIAERVREPYV